MPRLRADDPARREAVTLAEHLDRVLGRRAERTIDREMPAGLVEPPLRLLDVGPAVAAPQRRPAVAGILDPGLQHEVDAVAPRIPMQLRGGVLVAEVPAVGDERLLPEARGLVSRRRREPHTR